LIGIVGFPVFAGFRGGLAQLVGPTGGYLWAYPLMAALIGALSDMAKTSMKIDEGTRVLHVV
jgi:biotin transport system substrate-specific component